MKGCDPETEKRAVQAAKKYITMNEKNTKAGETQPAQELSVLAKKLAADNFAGLRDGKQPEFGMPQK